MVHRHCARARAKEQNAEMMQKAASQDGGGLMLAAWDSEQAVDLRPVDNCRARTQPDKYCSQLMFKYVSEATLPVLLGAAGLRFTCLAGTHRKHAPGKMLAQHPRIFLSPLPAGPSGTSADGREETLHDPNTLCP